MRNFFSFKNQASKNLDTNHQKTQIDKVIDNESVMYEKLKSSEMRYRRLFESAKDGILIVDFETGKIVDANQYIIRIIARPLQEIVGKKLWEIGLFSNKEESEQAFSELQANGYIRFDDMPIQQQNGKITEVEFVSNVYLENNTKIIQCNIRDVTERKLAERALIESEKNLIIQNNNFANLNNEYLLLNQELINSINDLKSVNIELVSAKIKAEESDKLKSAFLANMSHEIRTPINAIMGFSEFLLDSNLPKENLESFVHIINSSCQNLMSIISDVLDISKIEANQISIDYKPININTFMNDLFETYEKLIEGKQIQVRLLYSPNRPKDFFLLKSDENRIKQALCNLLNNAIKFTKEGKIEFGYKIKEKFVEFYVKDTGIGVAPENQAIIFQRFRQVETSNNREFGGNGLGLSISKALVEKLGGNIYLTSELGKGSTFTFTIPYSNEIVNAEIPSPAAKAKDYDWNNKTILLVEDEKFNHTYIEEILKHTNAKVLNAWDGQEAVEQVKRNSDISLVLMDIKMPVMDGYESMRLIKHMRPTIPIIAQTAFALNSDREQALEGGFDNYISKPIDKEYFMAVIDNYLN